MRGRRRWSDLSPFQQKAVIAAVCIELPLTAVAWVDLVRRPDAEVCGPKSRWAVALLVQPVGPIAYLTFGVRRENC
jgi:hypothetical protein